MRLKTLYSFFLLILSVMSMHAQEEVEIKNPVDSLYREDQFYINLSYNMMQNKPDGFKQRGFISNFGFGFLRDFPLNKRRNIAIAPGVGYTFSYIKSNLMVLPKDYVGDSNFTIVDEKGFNKNFLTMHSLDVPIELRWRTSVPESHKFLRIYTGVKFSYIFANNAKYKDSEMSYKVSDIPEINKFQYGIYVSAGYNTWNAYVYYGLNPLFKSVDLAQGTEVKLNALHLGLMFYIL
ncbi:MAG: PorT family protein [Flavobacterium sp.]|nr:PorT family protein [Candidatus Neoflavobacterium equi]